MFSFLFLLPLLSGFLLDFTIVYTLIFKIWIYFPQYLFYVLFSYFMFYFGNYLFPVSRISSYFPCLVMISFSCYCFPGVSTNNNLSSLCWCISSPIFFCSLSECLLTNLQFPACVLCVCLRFWIYLWTLAFQLIEGCFLVYSYVSVTSVWVPPAHLWRKISLCHNECLSLFNVLNIGNKIKTF